MPTFPAVSKQSSSVPAQLFTAYYRNGKAVVGGASSHWQAFSRHFRVRIGDDGAVRDLLGYGFGESDRPSVASRSFAAIGNWLHVLTLDAPGLRAEIPLARTVVRKMGLHFSQDAFRQACTAWFLGRANVGGTIDEPGTILIIGDGHGILSALLHDRFPSARVMLVDLGATLLFQAAYLTKAFPSAVHALAGEGGTLTRNATFLYCPAEEIERFPEGTIDLAINVASMQEMTPAAVAAYFKLLRERNTRLFYCCNRLEKRLPGGEVLRFMAYPWSPGDEHLVDEPCPWHQWFFGRVGSPRVRLGGVPIPLVHRYDGMHWHRLTLLAHDF